MTNNVDLRKKSNNEFSFHSQNNYYLYIDMNMCSNQTNWQHRLIWRCCRRQAIRVVEHRQFWRHRIRDVKQRYCRQTCERALAQHRSWAAAATRRVRQAALHQDHLRHRRWPLPYRHRSMSRLATSHRLRCLRCVMLVTNALLLLVILISSSLFSCQFILIRFATGGVEDVINQLAPQTKVQLCDVCFFVEKNLSVYFYL